MPGFNPLYRGPRSWLVWLNILVSFGALVPILIESSVVLLVARKVNWGEWGIMFMGLNIATVWIVG